MRGDMGQFPNSLLFSQEVCRESLCEMLKMNTFPISKVRKTQILPVREHKTVSAEIPLADQSHARPGGNFNVANTTAG